MSGNIALVLAPLHGDGVEHITNAPRWTPPSDADGYWHIPRSISAEDFGGYGIGRVLFWCGCERDMPLDLLTNREPVGLRCGTCVGRASGYERKDGTIFQPRSAFDPPRVCPALVGDNARCRVCDGKERMRRNYCHYDEVSHRPGPGLVEFGPCPRHGWKDLREECLRAYTDDGYPTLRETGRVICCARECSYVLFSAEQAYASAWDAAIHTEQRRQRTAALLSRTQPRRP